MGIRRKWSTWVGLAFTAVWVLAAAVIWYYNPEGFRAMKPNEWGDFLAGIAAPPALVWLVAGYFQHGREIQLQIGQTAELTQRAEQQVETSRSLLEHETARETREARPEFVVGGGMGSQDMMSRSLANRGGEALDPELVYDGPYHLSVDLPNIFDQRNAAHIALRATVLERQTMDWPIEFGIKCTDRLGNEHQMMFTMDANGNVKKIAAGGSSYGQRTD